MLDHDEVVDLLTMIAASDGRRGNITEEDVTLWSSVLTQGGVRYFADAKAAIVDHLATSGEWLMPIHVIRGVSAIRAERVKDMPLPETLMADADPELRAVDYPAELRRRQRVWLEGQSRGALRAIGGAS